MSSARPRDPLGLIIAVVRRAIRWRLSILIAAGLLTVASLAISRRLSVTSDLTALLPDDNPDLRRLRAMQGDKGEEQQFMLMFSKNLLFAADLSGRVHRFDGQRWLSEPISRSLHAAWGFAANDVFVAGSEGTVAHFDGQRWSIERRAQRSTLRGLWGASAGDLVAVGDRGTIIRRDRRGQWRAEQSHTDRDLRAVSGDQATGVVAAVGAQGLVLLRREGRWQPEPTGVADQLNGVWVGPGGGVFAVGDHGLVLRREGESWRRIPSNTKVRLTAVWGTAANNVFLVGERGVVLHYDGATLRATSLPTPTSQPLAAIQGFFQMRHGLQAQAACSRRPRRAIAGSTASMRCVRRTPPVWVVPGRNRVASHSARFGGRGRT